jgi:hypothetical protein
MSAATELLAATAICNLLDRHDEDAQGRIIYRVMQQQVPDMGADNLTSQPVTTKNKLIKGK